MGEYRFTALGVPDRSTCQITADSDPDHERDCEPAFGSPSGRRRLGTDLHHRRPDVIEELNLGTGPKSSNRLTDPPANDVRLGQGSVVAPSDPELPLEPVGSAEDAALSFHDGDDVLTGVSDVLAENADPLVRGHLLVQRALDRLAERNDFRIIGRVVGGRARPGDHGKRDLLGDRRRVRAAGLDSPGEPPPRTWAEASARIASASSAVHTPRSIRSCCMRAIGSLLCSSRSRRAIGTWPGCLRRSASTDG